MRSDLDLADEEAIVGGGRVGRLLTDDFVVRWSAANLIAAARGGPTCSRRSYGVSLSVVRARSAREVPAWRS